MPLHHRLSPRISTFEASRAPVMRFCSFLHCATRPRRCVLFCWRLPRGFCCGPREQVGPAPIWPPITSPGDPDQDRPRTVDELAAQVLIAPFAYAAKPRFAPSRVLSGNQTDPCCHSAARREVPPVIDGGNQCGCDHRPDAGEGSQSFAAIIGFANCDQLSIDLGHALVRGLELSNECIEVLLRQGRQFGFGNSGPDILAEPDGTDRNDNAIFPKKTTDMIDQSGALRDEPVACSVQHLQILLLSRLHRYKPHSRTLCGLVDRLCMTASFFEPLTNGITKRG